MMVYKTNHTNSTLNKTKVKLLYTTMRTIHSRLRYMNQNFHENLFLYINEKTNFSLFTLCMLYQF